MSAGSAAPCQDQKVEVSETSDECVIQTGTSSVKFSETDTLWDSKKGRWEGIIVKILTGPDQAGIF